MSKPFYVLIFLLSVFFLYLHMLYILQMCKNVVNFLIYEIIDEIK